MTIGVDFFKKKTRMNIKEIGELTIIWHIWDISGQPYWKELRPAFYRGARGALVIYDIANFKSYENAFVWAREFVRNAGPYPIVLVGNKIDLRDKVEGCLTFDGGLRMAERISRELSIDVSYVETSALLGINIDDAFNELAKSIIRYVTIRKT